MTVHQQLREALEPFAGQPALGIWIDPALAVQLQREKDVDGLDGFTGMSDDGGRFDDYPIKVTPRAGAWLILDGGEVLDREVLLISGHGP